MQRTFHRDRFTWLAYLSLALYGYFLNVLGPITPFLKDELRLTYTVSSFHFTAFAVGMLLVGAGGHWVIQRIGRGLSLWLGLFDISLGSLLLLATDLQTVKRMLESAGRQVRNISNNGRDELFVEPDPRDRFVFLIQEQPVSA